MASRPKIRQRAKGELANEIAKAIQIRAYRPGEWLRQIDLEEAFQATRFDVRTALDELAIRKTIEHVPNRGYRVVEIDLATYRAIRDTRIILESAASRLVIGRMDEEAVARLDALAHEFSRAVQSGTRVEQSEINRAFHSLIYAHCGNPVLAETIWSLRYRSRGSAVTVWASHQALLASDADHHAMVAAIRAGDGERLAELISQHILKDLIEAGGAA